MQTTSNPADVAARQQIFLDGNYFQSLMFKLKFHKYGVARTVPAKSGHTSVRYFRPRKANTTGVNRMGTDYNEGVVPTNLAEVSVGYIDAYLNQTIWYSKISDLELAIDLIDPLKLHSKKAGEDMALYYDEINSNSMFANPAVAGNRVDARQATLYNSNTGFERFNIANPTGNSAADYATLLAASADSAKMSRAFHIACMTQLEENDVPMVNNRYPVICAPRVTNDMRQDSQWFAAAVFNASALSLFPGGEFELDGGIFVTSTRSYREAATYGTRDNTGNIFGVAYLGQDAFVVPKLSSGRAGGGGDAPIMTLIDKADNANPANQFASLTAKAYYGSALIYNSATSDASDVPHVVLGRVQSTFA
jgi:N4-gp56 family major capsid protein